MHQQTVSLQSFSRHSVTEKTCRREWLVSRIDLEISERIFICVQNGWLLFSILEREDRHVITARDVILLAAKQDRPFVLCQETESWGGKKSASLNTINEVANFKESNADIDKGGWVAKSSCFFCNCLSSDDEHPVLACDSWLKLVRKRHDGDIEIKAYTRTLRFCRDSERRRFTHSVGCPEEYNEIRDWRSRVSASAPQHFHLESFLMDSSRKNELCKILREC